MHQDQDLLRLSEELKAWESGGVTAVMDSDDDLRKLSEELIAWENSPPPAPPKPIQPYFAPGNRMIEGPDADLARDAEIQQRTAEIANDGQQYSSPPELLARQLFERDQEARRQFLRQREEKIARSGLTPEQFAQQEELEIYKETLPGFEYMPIRAFWTTILGAGNSWAALGARVTGRGDLADEIVRDGADLERMAQLADESGVLNPRLARGIRGASQSLFRSGVSAVAGGLPAIIAEASAASASEAITEGRDAGLSGTKLAAYAATIGGIEGATTALFSKIGLGGVESRLAAKALTGQTFKAAAKQLGKDSVGELTEEQTIFIGQSVAKYLSSVDPNALDTQRLADGMLDVAIQTAIATGAVNTPNLARSVGAQEQSPADAPAPEPAPEQGPPPADAPPQATPPQPPPYVVPRVDPTAQGAGVDWARNPQHRQAAEKLASTQGAVTRTMLSDALGIPRNELKTTPEQRAAFRDEVRAAMEEPTSSPRRVDLAADTKPGDFVMVQGREVGRVVGPSDPGYMQVQTTQGVEHIPVGEIAPYRQGPRPQTATATQQRTIPAKGNFVAFVDRKGELRPGVVEKNYGKTAAVRHRGGVETVKASQFRDHTPESFAVGESVQMPEFSGTDNAATIEGINEDGTYRIVVGTGRPIASVAPYRLEKAAPTEQQAAPEPAPTTPEPEAIAPASKLPPEFASATDEELTKFLTNMGVKKKGKKRTREQLEQEVADLIFAKTPQPAQKIGPAPSIETPPPLPPELPKPKKTGRKSVDAVPAAMRAKTGKTFEVQPETDLERQQVAAGKAIGINVRIVDTDSADGLTVRGWMEFSDPKTVWVGRNGVAQHGEDIHRAVTAVFAHEVHHTLRRSHPELWSRLADVIQRTDAQGLADAERLYMESAKDWVPEQHAMLEKDAELRREEAVSSYLENVLADKGFIERLARTDKNLFEKIADFIRSLVGKLKGNPILEEVQAVWDQVRADVRQEGETVNETPPSAPPMGIVPPGAFPFDTARKDVSRGISRAGSFARRFFTTAGHLPQEVARQKVVRDGWVQSQLKQADFTSRDLKTAAKKAYGSAFRQYQGRVDAVMKGEQPAESLPKPLRAPVTKMRQEIDALSSRLIDSGAIEGDLALTVEENMGTYVTRSYRVYDDPNWADKVDADVRNKAKALIRKEYPEYTEDQIEGLIKSLLYNDKAADTPIAILSRSRLGSKDLSITKHRKAIPEEIRALWGEYDDPVVNYVRSVTKMAHLIGNHQFLTSVREQGMGQFFSEQPTGELFARIAADKEKTMAPLDGIYTTPEIQKAFEREFAKETPAEWLRLYYKVNGFSKYAKTVLSLQTHVRNFTGNTGFAIANGHWDVRKMGEAFKATVAGLNLSRNEDFRAYYRKLTNLGLVNESVHANELRDAIRDAMNLSPEQFTDSTIRRGVRKTGKALADWYQAGDSVWKVYAFENEMARYKKAMPEASQEQLEKLAADIVRDTYPTYSQIPEGVRSLRKFPFLGPFISFASEVYRTTYNALRLTARELADPATRTIGAQRLAGQMTAAGMTAGIGVLSRFLLGIAGDKEDDLREFLAPWSENSDLVWLGNEDGKPEFIDLSYTDPFSYWRNPITAFLQGEDLQEAAKNAAGEVLAPFFGEEILAGKIVDIMRNQKVRGGQVYNPQDPVADRLMDQFKHLADAVEPGTITSAKRIKMAATGEIAESGRSFDLATEVGAVLTGLRMQTIDVRQSLGFRIRDYDRNLNEATRILLKAAQNRGTIGSNDLADAYQRADAARREHFDDMHRKVWAAIRLGVTEEEAQEMLVANKVGKEEAIRIIAGNYQPYKPSRQLLAGVKGTPGGEQRIKTLQDLYVNASQNPDEARQVLADEQRKEVDRMRSDLRRGRPRRQRGDTAEKYQERVTRWIDARNRAAEFFSQVQGQ